MTDAELNLLRGPDVLRAIIGSDVKLKRIGKALKGCCPFHPEKTPSFTVFDDGRFKCFGCDAKGDVFAYVMQRDHVNFPRAAEIVANARGMKVLKSNDADTEQWDPITPPPTDAPQPTERLFGTPTRYEYIGLEGCLLFYQRRFDEPDGKRFAQLTYGRLTKHGRTVTGWHPRGPAHPFPLYRLDRITVADPDEYVLVVEGEKACHAAERLFSPMVVTTWLNGANAVHLADWTPLRRFREDRIIWWPDADKPREDGRAHGCFVATPVFRKLFPGTLVLDTAGLDDIKDGFDAADLEQLSDVEDYDAWLQARIKEPEPETDIPGHQKGTQKQTTGIWDAGDDHDMPPPRGWLLGALFCRQFMSSLLADGGVGKTAVRLVQLISLAIGRSLSGEHVFQRCRVLILSLEDSRDELRRRVKAVLGHFNLTPADVKGFLFLDAPKGIRLAEMKDGAPVVGPLKGYLEDAIRTHQLDIISLDPFVKTHALPENSNDAIDWVCTVATEMAIEHDIAFDSPHHTNKGFNQTPGDASRGRGASSRNDAGRLVYTLTPMSTEEAKEFSVPEAERRSLIRMDSAKVNITPPSTEAKWFRLVSVPLGNATPQYPNGDHIQVAEPWTPPKTFEGLHHPLLNAILDDIEAGMKNGRRYSNGSAATDRAAWRVVQAHASEKSEKQCRDVITAWLRSGTLFTEDYDDPVTHKSASGLRVNAAKRPS